MVNKNMIKSKKVFRFEDGEINFKAEKFLFKLEVDNTISVANHIQFHPVRSYKHSLKQVLRPIEGVADLFIGCIEEKFNNYDDEMNEELIELVENMLHNIISHVDTCKNIIKQLSGEMKSNDIQNEFLNSIESYRSFFAKQINLVKHNSRFIRIIRGRDEKEEGNFVIGYYIEGKHELVDSENSTKGAVGPDPNVHELYMGRTTAFSLNKHLRLIIWFLLFISQNLYDSIKKIESLKTIRCSKKNNNFINIYPLVKKIMKIPQCYFPDEVNISKFDAPYINKVKNNINIGNVISEYSLDLITLPSFKITYSISLDNEHIFLIPYLMK